MVAVKDRTAAVSMRILAADDDPAFRRFLENTISARPPHELELVADGPQALARALAHPRPDIVVLDWMMPRLDGTQVCRLLRDRPEAPYLMVVTGRRRREEVLACLNAGADDVLTKPVAPDLLVARIALAERHRTARGTASGHLREALLEASRQGDGELVIRSRDVSARVFFHAGAIAWADVSSGAKSLLHDLMARGHLDTEMARSALEECRDTGASLIDVIVDWSIVDRDELSRCVAEWMRATLAIIVELPEARSLFLPQKRPYSGVLLYPTEEILPPIEITHPPTPPAGQPPSLIPASDWEQSFVRAPERRPHLEEILDRGMRMDGILGMTAFGRLSGYCFDRRGAEINPDVAWAQIQALNAIMRVEPVFDSVVCTSDRYHFVHLVPGEEDALVYALVNATEVQLAMARVQLRRAVQGG